MALLLVRAFRMISICLFDFAFQIIDGPGFISFHTVNNTFHGTDGVKWYKMMYEQPCDVLATIDIEKELYSPFSRSVRHETRGANCLIPTGNKSASSEHFPSVCTYALTWPSIHGALTIGITFMMKSKQNMINRTAWKRRWYNSLGQRPHCSPRLQSARLLLWFGSPFTIARESLHESSPQ
jgi:hypothetical protein